MNEPILIDTGPLVAILQATEQNHMKCVDVFQQLQRPPVTCWPVLTEAAWLLRKRVDYVVMLLQFWREEVIRVEPLDQSAAAWIMAFMYRYADQQPQIADAALMYLADSFGVNTIFTLDRRDFSIYRRTNGEPLTIIPSWSELT